MMMICLPLDWFLLNLGSVVSDAASLSTTIRAVRFDMGSRSELQGWPSLDCLLRDPLRPPDAHSPYSRPVASGTWVNRRHTDDDMVVMSYHESVKVVARPGR